MQIELHEVQGFWPAIWGMRNPMQSHDWMDSEPPEEADFAIHDVYNTGDKVTYKEEHYTCKQDNVAHSPEALPDAWEKAAE